MSRISQQELKRIEGCADLAALIRSRGIELAAHGDQELIGCCPFHQGDEKTLLIYPAEARYVCTACGETGSTIRFIQQFDKISFHHACELLVEGGESLFKPVGCGKKKSFRVRKLKSPFDPDASDETLITQVADYYHERLLKSPDALDYLRKRGLYDEAVIEKFRLGFADRSLGLRLPEKSRIAGKKIRERFQRLGIIRRSGHEHFNGSITVPVFDENGQVVEIYGRKITSRLRKGTPLHLYLAEPHRGVWNRQALLSEDLVLCEAPFDALSFYVHGVENSTFIYGTDGFSDELFDALVSNGVRRVRLAYDNDDDGNQAAERDIRRLAAAGIEVYRIHFPCDMDANSYVVKALPDAEPLQMLVEGAEWLGGAGVPHVEAGPLPLPAGNTEAAGPALLQRGDYHFLKLGSREYRIGGLDKNNSLDILKVTLRVRHGDDFHLDTVDLAKDSDRRRFIERAHEETRLEKALMKHDLGRMLLLLDDVQTSRLDGALKPKEAAYEMTTEQRDAAMDLLTSRDLVERIGVLFDRCGLVGEEANRLAAYLACTSRKLSQPLAVIVQSTSAAGKSTLMESVLAMFPEEDQIKYSAMTGQSLYYLGETNLKHRILAIVEEEGAERASYALKLLQSEGELTIASTGKDSNTGRMETQQYHVEGPVMIFLTTTSINIDEELQNRCLTLSVDESQAQTERIHELQRKARTLEGLKLREERKQVLTLMRNAQRLLDPIAVVNPYADRLTFTAARTRTRRDHEKYLTLIDAIALLHQHQRARKRLPTGKEYIEVSSSDIELANSLALDLLSWSLDDLPPQTRRLYDAVRGIVRERMERQEIGQRYALFSRREVRERLGWSVTQTRVHLERLRDMEYVAARFGRLGSAYQYELLIDIAEEPEPFPAGLVDAAALRVRRLPVGAKDSPVGGVTKRLSQVQSVGKERVRTNLSA